jgi:two-component system NarL family sensor kinase
MHTGKHAGLVRSGVLRVRPGRVHANVAVLDARGEILAVNEAWVQFVDLNDLKFARLRHRLQLSELLRSAGHARRRRGGRRACGLLIAGGDGPFRHEYVMPLDTGSRWVKLSAVRVGHLNRPFLIVAHEDISIQRRAELACARPPRASCMPRIRNGAASRASCTTAPPSIWRAPS